MNDRQKLLQDWTEKLLTAFEIDGTEVDIDAVLDLAAKAAHGVVRPAAPLTTFVVGYAAGLAVASGQAQQEVAMRSAMAVADALCADASTDEEPA